MRLLIVVDKLLTGFDAPRATYLYIDKKMQDHGLFQAICRVNRLDGDDKDYGYIVDYRDLFNSLESAITDYTSGALDGYEKEDIEGLLSDRIEKAREDLDEALETDPGPLRAGRAAEEHAAVPAVLLRRRAGNAEQLKANEPKRVELYKAVAAVTRAYGNLANEMAAAGYSDAEAAAIKDEIAHYAAVRDEVKLGAGEDVDFKQYEAGMRLPARHLHPGRASEIVSDFEDAGLIQLIVQAGRRRDRQAARGHQEGPRSRRRDDHQQHAQGDHRRARDEPEVLRQDVRAARRPPRGATPGRDRLQGSTSRRLLAQAAASSARGIRHRLPRLGRQRRPAGAHRLRLPDDRRRGRSRPRRHAHASPTTGSATRSRRRRSSARCTQRCPTTSTGSTNCLTW